MKRRKINLRKKLFSCPLCHTIAEGSQGYAAHWRGSHPTEYRKGRTYYNKYSPVHEWDLDAIHDLCERANETATLPKDGKGVVRPAHYVANGYEARDVLNAFFETDPLLWNAGKYILRAGKKESLIEDCQKAIQYLEWRIEKEGAESE